MKRSPKARRFAIALGVSLVILAVVHWIDARHDAAIRPLFDAGRIDDSTYAPDQLFRELGEAVIVTVAAFCAVGWGWCWVRVRGFRDEAHS